MGILLWGCLAVGGVVTTINPSYGTEELAFQVKDTGAKLIAVFPDLLNTVQVAAAQFALDVKILIIDYPISKESGDTSTLFSMLEKAVVLKDEHSGWRKSVNAGKDLAFLIYSSGTTGRPKGVMLTHRNLVSNILQISSVDGPNLSWQTDKVLGFLPLYHIYGKSQTITFSS